MGGSWRVGTPEPLFARLSNTSSGEVTGGTLSIYISTPDGAGDFEYVDTDGSTLTAARTAWKTGLTYDADDGFGAWFTPQATLANKDVDIEYEHSTLGYITSEPARVGPSGALTVKLDP